MGKGTKTTAQDLILSAIGAGLAALIFVANYNHLVGFWGINFGAFLPSPWVSWIAIAAMVFAIPAVARRMDALMSVAPVESVSRKAGILVGAVVGAGLIAIFYLFSTCTILLGDGILRVNQIGDGKFWLFTEAGDFALHALFYNSIGQSLGLTPTECYQYISIASGLLFVWGCYRLAKYLFPEQWLLATLLLVSSTLSVQFFGYIESYSIIAALLPLTVLCGLKVIDGRISNGWFVALLLVAFAVHSVAPILLSAAALVAMYSARQGGKSSTPRLNRVLFIATGLIVVIIYATYSFAPAEIQRHILPIIASDQQPQALATRTHLIDLLNWLLGSGLPAIFLAAVLIVYRGKGDGNARYRAFAVWLIVPALCFLFFFRPELEGPRDWDLFSLPAFLLIPALLILVKGNGHRRLQPAALSVAILGLTSVAGFAVVNRSPVAAVNRFAEVIEYTRFKSLLNEYAQLLGHAQMYPDLAGRRVEFAKDVLREGPPTKWDTLATTARIIQGCLAEGNRSEARRYIDVALTVDSTDETSLRYLATLFNMMKLPDSVRWTAGLLAARLPRSASAVAAAGQLYFGTGDPATGTDLIQRAYRLDSTDYNAAQAYGFCRLNLHQYADAITVLEKLAAKKSDDFDVLCGLAEGYYRTGRRQEAQAMLSRAGRLASTGQQQREVAGLARLLRGEQGEP